MKTQTKKHTKIWISGFLSALLIASITFVVYVNAQSSVTPLTLTRGIYPAAPTYTIWTESGTIYAKNSSGAISYSGTNASAVINAAIQSLTSIGGLIKLTAGTYLLDTPIRMNKNHLTISGESQGSTCISWVGSVGNYMLNNTVVPVYDLTIENLNLQTNGDAHAIWVNGLLRFNFHDLLISGYTDGSNSIYHGIVLRASGGTAEDKHNTGWGIIDNVIMDYVHYAICFWGDDENNVVTLVNVGYLSATHVSGFGLNFYEWADTIDVKFATLEAAANNVSGAAISMAHDTNDVGVYNIHFDRLIFDNWHYSGTYSIKINNAKQIIFDSVFKGNSTDTLFSISNYATGIYIVQQGQENGSNGIIIYTRNITETGI